MPHMTPKHAYASTAGRFNMSQKQETLLRRILAKQKQEQPYWSNVSFHRYSSSVSSSVSVSTLRTYRRRALRRPWIASHHALPPTLIARRHMRIKLGTCHLLMPTCALCSTVATCSSPHVHHAPQLPPAEARMCIKLGTCHPLKPTCALCSTVATC